MDGKRKTNWVPETSASVQFCIGQISYLMYKSGILIRIHNNEWVKVLDIVEYEQVMAQAPPFTLWRCLSCESYAVTRV